MHTLWESTSVPGIEREWMFEKKVKKPKLCKIVFYWLQARVLCVSSGSGYNLRGLAEREFDRVEILKVFGYVILFLPVFVPFVLFVLTRVWMRLGGMLTGNDGTGLGVRDCDRDAARVSILFIRKRVSLNPEFFDNFFVG